MPAVKTLGKNIYSKFFTEQMPFSLSSKQQQNTLSKLIKTWCC